MTILSIILGLIMIIGGVTCMASPLTTFVSTGYFVSVMLLLYAIAGIIRYTRKKADVLEIVLSVLAIILCVISLFLPGTTLVFNTMMIYMTAAWFLVQGVVTIVLAFKVRKEVDLWFLGLISGILGVIVGVYSFLHPAVLALSAGMLIGFHFIETGINTIVIGTIMDRTDD